MLAHMDEQGQTEAKKNERGKQLNGGKNLRWAVGMAGKDGSRQTQSLLNRYCRRTQPVDSPSGTGLKTTASSWPALQQKQQLPTMLAGLSPCSAGEWREYGGAGSQESGCRPTYTVPTPPIAFACHCPYPLP